MSSSVPPVSDNLPLESPLYLFSSFLSLNLDITVICYIYYWMVKIRYHNKHTRDQPLGESIGFNRHWVGGGGYKREFDEIGEKRCRLNIQRNWWTMGR
jgi:hypothetical protein